MKQIGLGEEKVEKRGHITLFQSKMGFTLLDLPSCSRAASCHAKCDLTITRGYPHHSSALARCRCKEQTPRKAGWISNVNPCS